MNFVVDIPDSSRMEYREDFLCKLEVDPFVRVNKVAGNTFTVDERYRFEDTKLLGKGSFGLVAKAFDTVRHIPVAIKRVRPYAPDCWEVIHHLREIKLMKLMGWHPNMVKLLELSLHKPKEELYFIMELMDTDLYRIIKSSQTITEGHIKCFLKQILEGVKALHQCGIFHRDLKPGNILISKNCHIRIADLGLARFMHPSTLAGRNGEYPMTHTVVTTWYRAPELLLSSPLVPYTSAIDLWSVGCIFAELMLRKPLFPGKNPVHQVQEIFKIMGYYTQEDLGFPLSPEARYYLRWKIEYQHVPFAELLPEHFHHPDTFRLLEQLLTVNPKRRVTAEEALNSVYLHSASALFNYDSLISPTPSMDNTGGIYIEEVKALVAEECFFEEQSLSLSQLVSLLELEVAESSASAYHYSLSSFSTDTSTDSVVQVETASCPLSLSRTETRQTESGVLVQDQTPASLSAITEDLLVQRQRPQLAGQEDEQQKKEQEKKRRQNANEERRARRRLRRQSFHTAQNPFGRPKHVIERDEDRLDEDRDGIRDSESFHSTSISVSFSLSSDSRESALPEVVPEFEARQREEVRAILLRDDSEEKTRGLRDNERDTEGDTQRDTRTEHLERHRVPSILEEIPEKKKKSEQRELPFSESWWNERPDDNRFTLSTETKNKKKNKRQQQPMHDEQPVRRPQTPIPSRLSLSSSSVSLSRDGTQSPTKTPRETTDTSSHPHPSKHWSFFRLFGMRRVDESVRDISPVKRPHVQQQRAVQQQLQVQVQVPSELQLRTSLSYHEANQDRAGDNEDQVLVRDNAMSQTFMTKQTEDTTTARRKQSWGSFLFFSSTETTIALQSQPSFSKVTKGDKNKLKKEKRRSSASTSTTSTSMSSSSFSLLSTSSSSFFLSSFRWQRANPSDPHSLSQSSLEHQPIDAIAGGERVSIYEDLTISDDNHGPHVPFTSTENRDRDNQSNATTSAGKEDRDKEETSLRRPRSLFSYFRPPHNNNNETDDTETTTGVSLPSTSSRRPLSFPLSTSLSF